MAGRALNLAELKKQVDKDGVAKTRAHLADAFKKKALSPDDFSLRETAEAFMGDEWVRALIKQDDLRESAGDAVAYSQFAQITGQVAFSAIMDSYQLPEMVFSQAIPTRDKAILDKEKIPGLTPLGDEFTVVGENDDYPLVGIGPDWMHIGEARKRGAIIPVTKELILGLDGSYELLRRCRELGSWLGWNKEKRLIDAVIDENAGATSIDNGGHRYHYRDTSYATYQSTSPWVNIKTSNALVDWTDFDGAWQLFQNMTEPNTGEPLSIMPTTVIVTPQNLHVALRVLDAIEVRYDTNASAGTPNNITIGASPIRTTMGRYGVLSSPLLAARAATDTDWWLCNPAKAWAYFAFWRLKTEERGSDAEAAFKRDVLFQFKASESGVAATMNPRYTVENQQ